MSQLFANANYLVGILIGLSLFIGFWFLLSGFYNVQQNERAVKTCFGRAERLGEATTNDSPISSFLTDEEKQRYNYPQLVTIPPGGPYFKWPWENVVKVNIATQTINIAQDLLDKDANEKGKYLEAVTKDQLNTKLAGQIRWAYSEQNLYAVLFGIKRPLAHVMGYFVSVLRMHVANFEKKAAAAADVKADGKADSVINQASGQVGVSINDLRKDLNLLNDTMLADCKCSVARYGIVLDASLITSIDPPAKVEDALSSVNTAHNEVSSAISKSQAEADRCVTESKSAVEVATNSAIAESKPILSLARELKAMKEKGGKEGLRAYVRNIRLQFFSKSTRNIVEV